MRLLLALALMASLCFFAAPSFASDAGASAGPTPEWVDSDAPEAMPPDVGSNADLMDKYEEVKAAYEMLRGADAGKMLLWFLLIAAVSNMLISAIKRFGKLTSRGKKYLPWVALGLGVVVGFASAYGMGVGLFAAVWYGAGPPAAVLIQELIHPIDSKE